MNKPRHVNFYADDWLGGTSGLSLEERGMYITACALIYAQGEAIAVEHLRRVCGAHGRTFNRVLRRLLDLGKLFERDGFITQARCETELKNARKRIEKWMKNLSNIEDNPEKSETYPDRAGGAAHTHTYTYNNQNPPPPTESPPPRARARPPEEVRAAPAEEEGKDFNISEEWIREVDEERQAEGKPPLDLHELARQTIQRWRHDPPRNCYLAWKGRALKAKPNPSLVPSRPLYEGPKGPPPKSYRPEGVAA